MAGAFREVFARLGFALEGADKLRTADKAVDRLTAKARGADESFASLGSGLVAAFAGNAVLGGINRFAAELDVLDDLSTQTDVATDALQVYDYAAQKSGASTEEFNASLSLLQKNLGKTGEATGAQTEALKDLKIDTSKPRELAEVLPEIFDSFARLPSSAKKAEVATALFGRAGVRLIPTLERGVEGMADLRAELEESGGIVSADTIAKAGEYRDNLARLDRSMFALKGTVAGALFPQLSKVTTIISKATGFVSDFAKNTTLAENAGLALAASLAGPVLSALRPFLGRGLKFAAVFAAVDEVLGFLDGKESLIADLLNGAFGDGTATKVRDWANDAIGALSLFANSTEATWAGMTDANASATTQWLALVVSFVRDASAGFPAFRAGFVGTLDEMFADIVGFVARALSAWAGFTQNLKLPPVVKAALALVPGGGAVLAAEAAAQASGAPAADAAAQAREVEAKARQAAADRYAEANAGQRGIRSNVFGTAAGGDAARSLLQQRQAVDEALRSTGLPGLGDLGGIHGRTSRVNAGIAGANATAAAAAPEAVQATLASAAASGQVSNVVLNDNKTVNLTFAKGTTAADQASIKAAVAEAIKSENRGALEALTQKAPRK